MSLLSYRLYKEMAPIHGSAAVNRGKSQGRFKDKEGRTINAAGTSRISLDIDQEALDFLDQFEQKDWTDAMQAREEGFIEILKKLQEAVNKEAKASGLEPDIFRYLKTGDAGGLDKQVTDFIDKKFTDESRKLVVAQSSSVPGNTVDLVNRIKELVKDLSVVGSTYILSDERRQVIAKKIQEAENASGDDARLRQLEPELKAICTQLQIDNSFEDLTEAFLYEVLRSKTVDNREFWRKNDLDPQAVQFPIGKGGRRSVSANPHFFRLYHRIERTRGEAHLEDLQDILGPVGKYGNDLKHPREIMGKDGKPSGNFKTLGATLGPTQKWPDWIRRYFQFHSHGQYGDHILTTLDPDNVAWMPVKVAGKLVEDPIFDWMLESLVSDIKDSWTELTDKGKKRPADPNLDDEDEDYGLCYSEDGVFKREDCAKEKARKLLVKAVQEGKIMAPPVPCTKATKDCPKKEDRMYKICDMCKGTGRPSSGGTKKKGLCQECGGDGVIKPPVYLPHAKNSKGVWNPILNPGNMRKMLHHDVDHKQKEWSKSSKEAHEKAISVAKSYMGDHFFKGIEYKATDGTTRSVGFPIFSDHDLEDSETLNLGNPAYTKSLGPNYGYGEKAQNFIDPVSPLGQEIINTVLAKSDFPARIKKEPRIFPNVVPDFMRGIFECLNRGTCANAPDFILDFLKDNAEDVYLAVYQSALLDLAHFKKLLRGFEEGDKTLLTFAASKTSEVAQAVYTSEGQYTRRTHMAGQFSRGTATGSSKEPGADDFGSDKGYSSSGGEKLRGAPFRGKQARLEAIRASVERLSLSPQQIQSLFSVADADANKRDQAVKSVPSSESDPIGSLRQKLKSYKEKTDEFLSHLKEFLIRVGVEQAKVQDFIFNSKDSSIEEIRDSLQAVDPDWAPKKKPISPSPFKAPTAPKQAVKGGGLAGRVKARQSQPDQAPQPSQPELEKDPKVDWFKFKSLPISERVDYLKLKLKNKY